MFPSSVQANGMAKSSSYYGKWIRSFGSGGEVTNIEHLDRYKASTKNIDMESGSAKLKENEKKVPVYCFVQIRLEK